MRCLCGSYQILMAYSVSMFLSNSRRRTASGLCHASGHL
jgi:hypothetical protein